MSVIETVAAGLASLAAPYISWKVRQAERKIDAAATRIEANELRSVANRGVLDIEGPLPPEPDPADDRMAVVTNSYETETKTETES